MEDIICGTLNETSREFTNKVHDKIAIPEIYRNLGWTVDNTDPEELEKIDLNDGIDYILLDRNGRKINVQERFREYRYHEYNDATLRYEREHNLIAERQKSEFYKIKADYLVYGIINASKWQILKDIKQGTFVKYAVIDVAVLREKIDSGLIIPDYSVRIPFISDGKMHAAVNENKDDSSSFIAFDVEGLNQLFGSDNIILTQKGYY